MEQNTIRPQTLSEFIGQETIKKILLLYLEYAKTKNAPMPHILLCGSSGLGKVTLAGIIANEMGVDFRMTSGCAIKNQEDLTMLLADLHEGDILFIDDIHCISEQIENFLCTAHLPKCTLIGEMINAEQLSAPLKDLFKITLQLAPYTSEELAEIIARSAKILKIEIEPDAVTKLAAYSKGTPRIANRLLKRTRDFTCTMDSGVITLNIVENMLVKMKTEEQKKGR